MSDTPRTDAEAQKSRPPFALVTRKYAEQLERELNAANAELERERMRLAACRWSTTSRPILPPKKSTARSSKPPPLSNNKPKTTDMKSTSPLKIHWQLLLAEYAMHNHDDFKSWLAEQELDQGGIKQITDAVLEFLNPNDP